MELIEEIARHLHNKSIGTLGTNLFYGHLPDVGGEFSILVRDTGGMAPNHDITNIKSPTFQVFIRSKSYNTGKDKLESIRDLLHGVINQYLILNGIYFRRIFALSEGGHIGTNEAGYDEFSINFEASIIE